MAVCGSCGAPIHWRRTGEGTLIPFEPREVMQGEGRYVDGTQGIVPCKPTADVMALQDHRVNCPDKR